ncbi:MAG: NmrA family NAD(P)-binding protein [Chitinophagaceae bacterium]|nr:NmrA family NAD(P)-binding protein [Chitinophagaceae bacterium]
MFQIQNDKTIFVTGATGNQGGAVVRNLVSKGFRVKALIRNPGKLRSKSITGENVEIIKGDLNDPSSYRNYLQNVDGVFCNLQFTAGVDKEIQQGLKPGYHFPGAGRKAFCLFFCGRL